MPSLAPLRRAFTLIEVIIAFTVVGLLAVLLYEILITMTGSGAVAQWESEHTTQFTNADSRLRDVIGKSSYPSSITPQGNLVLNGDSSATTAFFFSIPAPDAQGRHVFEAAALSDGDSLATWFRCIQGQKGIPGLPQQEPEAVQVDLVAKNFHATKVKGVALFDLHVQERKVTLPSNLAGVTSAPAPGEAGGLTRMVTDCRRITIKVSPRGQSAGTVTLPSKDPVAVTVEITCLESNKANAERSRSITADTGVGARAR